MTAPRAVGPPRPPGPVAPVVTYLWVACWQGRHPAEALDRGERELLVAYLVEDGLTDVQIAQRTRMTTYTTARIRGRLGLQPNRPADLERAVC